MWTRAPVDIFKKTPDVGGELRRSGHLQTERAAPARPRLYEGQGERLEYGWIFVTLLTSGGYSNNNMLWGRMLYHYQVASAFRRHYERLSHHAKKAYFGKLTKRLDAGALRIKRRTQSALLAALQGYPLRSRLLHDGHAERRRFWVAMRRPFPVPQGLIQGQGLLPAAPGALQGQRRRD